MTVQKVIIPIQAGVKSIEFALNRPKQETRISRSRFLGMNDNAIIIPSNSIDFTRACKAFKVLSPFALSSSMILQQLAPMRREAIIPDQIIHCYVTFLRSRHNFLTYKHTTY